MADFDPNDFHLNKSVRQILKLLDRTIEMYASRNRSIDHLTLYPSHWKPLNEALRNQSRGYVSLDTHTYRGLKLVTPPEGYRW